MTHSMEAIEATRTRFRPRRIMTLFVGESAPASGDFFYVGNTALKRHMQRVVEDAFGENGEDFLDRFKRLGWYLDDLVLAPVNQLPKAERVAKCQAARGDLAARIAAYRPAAIVSLLISIQPVVDAAALEAGSNAPRFAVPFPGMGQQARFRFAMAQIIRTLPRLTV